MNTRHTNIKKHLEQTALIGILVALAAVAKPLWREIQKASAREDSFHEHQAMDWYRMRLEGNRANIQAHSEAEYLAQYHSAENTSLEADLKSVEKAHAKRAKSAYPCPYCRGDRD